MLRRRPEDPDWLREAEKDEKDRGRMGGEKPEGEPESESAG